MVEPQPAYSGNDPYIFVSYSHADEDIVFREISWLQAQGINVWYDTTGIGPGTEWSDEIAKAIQSASRFVYFITPQSVSSEHCRRELNFAQAEGQAVVAIHLEKTEVPPGLRLSLDNRQAILKYRLKPEEFQTSLLRTLLAEASREKIQATRTAPSSNRNRPLIAVVAAMVLVAISSSWLWQRTSVDSSLVEPVAGAGASLTAVAVLPFDDLSPDADHAWLANGMAEDLIEALGRIDALHVPARRSTAILKQEQADLATIGQRLEVGSVVEGSVRRLGEDLSVIAQWIRVSDGARLWSAKYDRRVDDVLEIQREITIGIAEAIRTELGIRDAPASLLSLRYETSDVRAWELVKQAVPLAETAEPAKVAAAREMLLLATEYDPTFVEAHARLASLEYGVDVEKSIERLKEISLMDPEYPSVLGVYAWDSAMRFWDYDSAQQIIDRIPYKDRTVENLEVEFHLKRHTGRLDEALLAAERIVRLDPMWARGHCMVGWIHQDLGSWEHALESFERARGVYVETRQWGVWCSWGLAQLYLRSGRKAEAEAVIAVSETLQFHREEIRRGWEIGGLEGMSLAIADLTVNEGWPSQPWASCHYSALATAVELDRMFQCLEKEMEETAVAEQVTDFSATTRRLLLTQFLTLNESKERYGEDPRFQSLVRRLDQRMEQAAGTYEKQIGFDILP